MSSKKMILEESAEVWNCDTDEFSHWCLLLNDGQNYYVARLEDRFPGPAAVDVDKLPAKLIHPSHLWPPIEEGLTVVPSSISDSCYIKVPRLIMFDAMEEDFLPKDLLLKEA